MQYVVIYDNVTGVILVRQISWLKSALRDFEAFPAEVQTDAAPALSLAARGAKADTAKPFKSVDGGIFEIALRHRGDAFRVIYPVRIGEALCVVHAFKKKSKSGIEAPRVEVDLIRERLERLKETLK